MNFKKIESAYELILENSQLIDNEIKTNSYDALIEQNALYLGADQASGKVAENHHRLRSLDLTKEEWCRAYQFVLIKMGQTEPLQANHQFTPDAIGFLMIYLIEILMPQEHLTMIEIGSGTGNLAQTLLNNSHRDIEYLGLELDDLLIDLSASISEVIGSSARFVQEDAVRPQRLKTCDIILSDLPVGYYPNDEIAKRYQVAATNEHTYAHHLLMEQSLRYLKDKGLAIFLAPTNLLTSDQSHLLKDWLIDHAAILAVITLPETLFGNPANAKSLFVLQKKARTTVETFVYHLSNLQNPEMLEDFMENLTNWKVDNVI